MADALDQAFSIFGGPASAVDPLDAAMSTYVTQKQLTPKAASPAPVKPDPGMLGVLGNGLMKGVAGLGDMVGSSLVNAANLGIAGYGVAKHELTGSNDLPRLIPSDALSGYSKLGHAAGLIDDSKEPTTVPQRVGDFAAQVVGGGGINPKAIVSAVAARKAIPVIRDMATPVIGGVAGGSALVGLQDNLDQDKWYNRAATAILPAATQLTASYPTSSMNTAGERASQTTKNVTPAQWQAANALAQKAAALKAPLSAPEAIQAVTGNNPGLQSLQRVTEQSKSGVNNIAPAMSQRPSQNAALFGNVADRIFPNERSPDTIAGTLQKAATNAIDETRKQGNAAAAPFYARSSNDPNVMVPPHDWNTLASAPDVAWALDQTNNKPLGGVHNAQPGSLQWLDAAKKFLDSKGQGLQQQGERFPAGNAADASSLITNTVDPVVPDYAKARAIIAANMRNNVEPMQASQVGKLSESNNFVNQAASLLPEKPMDVTPGVINKTAGIIGAQDPTILPRFTAQHLRGTFNEANQDLQNGANQFGGAKFATRVSGNEMQAANLEQLLRSSGVNPAPLLDALEIFKAQGNRPAVGSATTFNNGETGLLSGHGGAMSMAGKPLQLPGLLAENFSYATSTKALSDALTPSGMTVEKFQALARANGAYSPAQQAAFAAALKASQSPAIAGASVQ